MSTMTKHQNLFRASAVMARRARRRLAGNPTNEVTSGMMPFGLVSYSRQATSLCIVLDGAPAGFIQTDGQQANPEKLGSILLDVKDCTDSTIGGQELGYLLRK